MPSGGPSRHSGGLRYDRSRRKPRVLVTGELLVNFHPGTNFHVEEYLERNDMEVILPRITYQFRKDFQAAISEIRDFGAHLAPYPFALDGAVEFIQRFLERIARSHPCITRRPGLRTCTVTWSTSSPRPSPAARAG